MLSAPARPLASPVRIVEDPNLRIPTCRFTYIDGTGSVVRELEHRAVSRDGHRVGLLSAAGLDGERASIFRTVAVAPVRLLDACAGIVVLGIADPAGRDILGECMRDGRVLLWGEAGSERLGLATGAAIVLHELAHCLRPDGDAPDSEAWSIARERDTGSRWRRARSRPVDVGGLAREVRTRSPWISCYAAQSEKSCEDWAESVMLFLYERIEPGFLGSPFAELFPARAALLDEWLSDDRRDAVAA